MIGEVKWVSTSTHVQYSESGVDDSAFNICGNSISYPRNPVEVILGGDGQRLHENGYLFLESQGLVRRVWTLRGKAR